MVPAPTQMTTTSRAARLPDSPPRVRVNLNKKQQLQQQFKQETTITATVAGFQQQLQKLWIHVSFFAEVVVPCLFYFRNVC